MRQGRSVLASDRSLAGARPRSLVLWPGGRACRRRHAAGVRRPRAAGRAGPSDPGRLARTSRRGGRHRRCRARSGAAGTRAAGPEGEQGNRGLSAGGESAPQPLAPEPGATRTAPLDAGGRARAAGGGRSRGVAGASAGQAILFADGAAELRGLSLQVRPPGHPPARSARGPGGYRRDRSALARLAHPRGAVRAAPGAVGSGRAAHQGPFRRAAAAGGGGGSGSEALGGRSGAGHRPCLEGLHRGGEDRSARVAAPDERGARLGAVAVRALLRAAGDVAARPAQRQGAGPVGRGHPVARLDRSGRAGARRRPARRKAP